MNLNSGNSNRLHMILGDLKAKLTLYRRTLKITSTVLQNSSCSRFAKLMMSELLYYVGALPLSCYKILGNYKGTDA